MKQAIFESIFFGIFLTLFTYQIGYMMQRKWKKPFLNPILIATILIIAVLMLFKVDYETYNLGGQYISFLLTPVTVCLAVPLYRQMEVLKKNLMAVLCGIISGCFAHILVLVGLAALFKLDGELLRSLLSKSVTTPIAIGITSEIGGITVITIAGVMVAGISGAVIGPYILKFFRIKEPVAQGLGLGTASHAVGTSKAMELGEVQGAMSSLAIVVTGILTVIIVPLVVPYLV